MSQKRIFFAADDKLVAALRDPLVGAGLIVETFDRQADLIAETQRDPPDALLLGARMADGTALAVFKALEPDPPPTLVVLTASQVSNRSGLLRAGITDVMISPIRPRVLASRLAELGGGLRRYEIRERAAVPVALHLDGRLVTGATFDISREGLGLRLDAPLREGEVVGISLNPPSGASLKMFGRVAYARFDGPQCVAGVRLLGLAPEEEATLQRFVQVYPLPPVIPSPQRTSPPSVARLIARLAGPRSRPPQGASRWPDDVLSLLEALDLLRYVMQSFPFPADESLPSETALAEWIGPRTDLEVDALRFCLGLSAIERQAFDPEPEIEVLVDELDALRRPLRPAPRPSLDPTLATALCLGAAQRLRVSLVEQAGRALVGRDPRRQSGPARGEILLNDNAVDDLVSALETWSLDLQTIIREAELAGDKRLADELRRLQDGAVRAASALTDQRSSVRAENAAKSAFNAALQAATPEEPLSSAGGMSR